MFCACVIISFTACHARTYINTYALSLSLRSYARACLSSINTRVLNTRVRTCVRRVMQCVKRVYAYVRTIFERARRRDRDDARFYQRTMEWKTVRERETEESREKRTNDRAENRNRTVHLKWDSTHIPWDAHLSNRHDFSSTQRISEVSMESAVALHCLLDTFKCVLRTLA